MSAIEDWVTHNNGLLTVIGTALAVVDPMIATWLDGNRSVQRGLVLVIVMTSLGAVTNQIEIPIGFRIVAFAALFAFLAIAIGAKCERMRRREKSPISCEALLGRLEIGNAGIDKLRRAKHSFDLAAVTGHTLIQDFRQDIEQRLENGVRFRVLILDQNNPNLAAFAQSVGLSSVSLTGLFDNATQILNALQADLAKHNKGDLLQVRTIKKRIPFYSIWIADKASANIQIFSHRGSVYHKAIRSADPSFVASVQEDFEELWSSSE